MLFFWFILYGTLWASWIWVPIYFPFVFWEVVDYSLLKYFLMPFLSLFFWNLYNSKIYGAHNIVPEVSETVFISFQSFSNSALLQVFPPHNIPAHRSGFFFFFLLVCLHWLFCYWFPLVYCFISVIVLFISAFYSLVLLYLC